mgnify:CR=1 FL=1
MQKSQLTTASVEGENILYEWLRPRFSWHSDEDESVVTVNGLSIICNIGHQFTVTTLNIDSVNGWSHQEQNSILIIITHIQHMLIPLGQKYPKVIKIEQSTLAPALFGNVIHVHAIKFL